MDPRARARGALPARLRQGARRDVTDRTAARSGVRLLRRSPAPGREAGDDRCEGAVGWHRAVPEPARSGLDRERALRSGEWKQNYNWIPFDKEDVREDVGRALVATFTPGRSATRVDAARYSDPGPSRNSRACSGAPARCSSACSARRSLERFEIATARLLSIGTRHAIGAPKHVLRRTGRPAPRRWRCARDLPAGLPSPIRPIRTSG